LNPFSTPVFLLVHLKNIPKERGVLGVVSQPTAIRKVQGDNPRLVRQIPWVDLKKIPAATIFVPVPYFG
jgi:hypothetical protein